MNYIISEYHLKKIILEQRNEKITDKISNVFDYVSDVFDRDNLGEKGNWKFWRSWGAAIGGFIMPLKDFLENGGFNINEWQVSLILFGIANVYFNNNEKQIKEILNKIKEEGLSDVFKSAYSKSEKIKSSFINFLSSLNLTASTVAEMMQYAFLIPIFDDLHSIANNTTSLMDASVMIAKRIVAAKGVSLSINSLVELINKILKKFSNGK
jgi:hypothetical protein